MPTWGVRLEGAAKAVISQVRLLAASELWNGSETEAPRYKDFKDKDGQLLAPQTYDPHKWELAADAAKDVMDLGIYHLYRNTESGDRNFDPYLSCRELFMSGTHAEVIFATHMAGDNWLYGHDIRCTPGPKGFCMSNATQNIVDAFLTADGYDINDDDSYTEVGFVQNDDSRHFGSVRNEIERGYRKGEHNMYVNREPRFMLLYIITLVRYYRLFLRMTTTIFLLRPIKMDLEGQNIIFPVNQERQAVG